MQLGELQFGEMPHTRQKYSERKITITQQKNGNIALKFPAKIIFIGKLRLRNYNIY